MRRFTITLRPKTDRIAARCIRLTATCEQLAIKQAVEAEAKQHGHWHWIVGPILAERV